METVYPEHSYSGGRDLFLSGLKKSVRSPSYLLDINHRWHTRAFSYNPLVRLTIGLVSVNVILLIYFILRQAVGFTSPFLLLFMAIMISGWLGGLIAGIFATVLSVLAALFIFILNSPELPFTPYIISQSLIFGVEGFMVSGIIHSMHGAIKQFSVNNQNLRKSEERFRNVVNAVKEYSMYSIDVNGYITSWNEGAARIKQYSPDEIIGKHYSVFFTQEDIDRQKPWNALTIAQNAGNFIDESYHVKKSGDSFWASMVITPVRDEKGNVNGYSVISRDLTERRVYEQRKDEFISIASHELKTPITSLKVFTQILLRLCANSQNKGPIRYLHKMDIQLDRLTLLVNDLLDVSKITAGKVELRKEEFDLNELIADTVEGIQGLSSVHRIVVKGKIIDPIVGDKDRISQVIINFLTNAIKYSPNSGEIVISLSQDGSKAIVSVKDFGVGIPVEYKEKVFDKFFRINQTDNNEFPGLGMGLYISSEIIKRHKGDIWVESDTGQGSTFYFSVPLRSHEYV